MLCLTDCTTFKIKILKRAEITAERKKNYSRNVNAREKEQNAELEKSSFWLMKKF